MGLLACGRSAKKKEVASQNLVPAWDQKFYRGQFEKSPTGCEGEKKRGRRGEGERERASFPVASKKSSRNRPCSFQADQKFVESKVSGLYQCNWCEEQKKREQNGSSFVGFPLFNSE